VPATSHWEVETPLELDDIAITSQFGCVSADSSSFWMPATAMHVGNADWVDHRTASGSSTAGTLFVEETPIVCMHEGEPLFSHNSCVWCSIATQPLLR
jgi:hypothetical protein